MIKMDQIKINYEGKLEVKTSQSPEELKANIEIYPPIKIMGAREDYLLDCSKIEVIANSPDFGKLGSLKIRFERENKEVENIDILNIPKDYDSSNQLVRAYQTAIHEITESHGGRCPRVIKTQDLVEKILRG